MARGGRGASGHHGGSHSAHVRSYVSGKIAGQYRAKGYSYAHARHIGDAVVRKMDGTFAVGRGSKCAYKVGFTVGAGSHVVRSSSGGHPFGPVRDAGSCASNNSIRGSSSAPVKTYAKRYGYDYAKHYGSGYR